MDGGVFVYKGINPEIDSYSAFFDNQKRSRTCLEERLRENRATDVYVCGLAYDICVGK
jgi:nicotinamidase/pyrazinamidase